MGETLPFELGEYWSAKKNWKFPFFLESQQYVYYHKIEEECGEFSCHLKKSFQEWQVALISGYLLVQS